MPDTAFSGLETARLLLRRFRADDAEAFQAYRSQPDTARYQSWDAPFPRSEADTFIAELADADPDTPGQWYQFAVERRSDARVIGDVGLKIDADDPARAEIGYTLDADATGHGFAAEAVAAVLDYTFGVRGKRVVEAWADARHARSLALLARLGFSRPDMPPRRGLFKGEWCDDIHHAMTAAAWMARRRDDAR